MVPYVFLLVLLSQFWHGWFSVGSIIVIAVFNAVFETIIIVVAVLVGW